MSHYITVKTQFKDAECVVSALLALGLQPAQVERHDVPQALNDFRGNVTQNKAHVIVRRSHMGQSTADLGIVCGDDSQMFSDPYSNNFMREHGGEDGLRKKITREYAAAGMIKTAKRQGKNAIRVEAPNGEIHVYANA